MKSVLKAGAKASSLKSSQKKKASEPAPKKKQIVERITAKTPSKRSRAKGVIDEKKRVSFKQFCSPDATSKLVTRGRTMSNVSNVSMRSRSSRSASIGSVTLEDVFGTPLRKANRRSSKSLTIDDFELDPSNPLTWAPRATGKPKMGEQKMKVALKKEAKKNGELTRRGNLKKKMGAPNKKELSLKKAKVWNNQINQFGVDYKFEKDEKNLCPITNEFIGDIDDDPFDDCNADNVLLRVVTFDKTQLNANLSMGDFLEQGRIAQELDADSGSSSSSSSRSASRSKKTMKVSTSTWHMIDGGSIEKSNKDYPYILKFAGHVRQANNFDCILKDLLSEAVSKKMITKYRVLRDFVPNEAEANKIEAKQAKDSSISKHKRMVVFKTDSTP